MSETIAVKTNAGGKPATTGTAEINTWTQKERTKRALKWLGYLWGGAFVSVFIPLLHFILVPMFALAGPIVASLMYGQQAVITGGKTACPHCGAEVTLSKGQASWPRKETCPSCDERMVLETTHA